MKEINSSTKYIIYLFICILSAFLFSSSLYAFSDLDIILSSSQLQQGELLVVTVKGNSEELHNLDTLFFNGNKYKFHWNNNKELTTLIPVSYWLSPDNYNLEIKSLDSSKKKFSTTIEIKSGNFEESRITVSSEQEEKVRPQNQETIDRRKRDSQLIAEAREKSSKQKLWEEKFIWPVSGKISSPFGATRYVNGVIQSRHSGIDIAAEQGTPVKASASGRVKLAENLMVTGNTIIIDHGWNISSSYSHLQDIKVENGAVVEKGDIIGSLGSTGFSTGPHLHWGVNVSGVFVNPEYFLEDTSI